LRWPSRGRRRTVVALAFAFALAACSPERRERIVLGTAHLPAMGLVFIAEAKGYFAERGVDVEHRRFTTGRDALVALEAGQLDAATAFETPVVLRASRAGDLRILTTLHVSNRSARLVARADRGIARARDLRGKRIGVPRDTNAEYFLHVLLAFGGVADREVAVVEVAPEAAADAIASGEVDAIATWPPHAERARRMLGAAGAVELGAEAYTEVSVLVTRAEVLAARREALVRVVRALADAERLVQLRPWEAFEALRSAFPESSAQDLEDAWRRVRPTLGLTHQLAAVLEEESRWFRAAGRIEGPLLDAGALLEPDVLAEVDGEAVTFVTPPRRPGPR
jgi:NitT/TauT family transport system substrate-binding protein